VTVMQFILDLSMNEGVIGIVRKLEELWRVMILPENLYGPLEC
jgi:hypothetical protein